MANVAEIRINVYQSGGEWFGARWIDGEYDGCDALEIDGDASEEEAIAHAESMPLIVQGLRTVERVEDHTPPRPQREGGFPGHPEDA